jgi:D-glycero-D-manno-heptose 1,7-bisphosphate phosphatase
VGVGALIKLRSSSAPSLGETRECNRDRRAAFLDRDGVLLGARTENGIPRPPERLAEAAFIAGVREACTSLKSAGFTLVVVSNQPDIARGVIDRDSVEAINRYVLDELSLDAVYTCPHDDADECICRKPKPGLITEAASDFGVVLEQSFVVGDRWRDIEAGARAGCSTIWIRRDYHEKPPDSPDHIASCLLRATTWMLTPPAGVYGERREGQMYGEPKK